MANPEFLGDELDVPVDRADFFSAEMFRNVPFGGSLVDLSASEIDSALISKKNALRRSIANAKSNGKDTTELEEELNQIKDLERLTPMLEKRDTYYDPRYLQK